MIVFGRETKRRFQRGNVACSPSFNQIAWI